MPPVNVPATALERIETRIDQLHSKIDEFLREYLREHAVVVSEARRAHDRINIVEADLATAMKRLAEMEKMLPWTRAMAWIITALSIPIILAALGFVWAVITHKVTIP